MEIHSFYHFRTPIKKPVPLDDAYLTRKGFNLKKRKIALTLQLLQNFVEVVTEDLIPCILDKDKDKEEDKDKSVLHTFSRSPFFEYSKFKEALKDWGESKIKHYHEAAISYENKGGKYKNWIKAVKNWDRLHPFLDGSSKKLLIGGKE